MAHLKTDFLTNNENRGHVNLLPSKSVDDATRKHTIKKQAFGELKNVIHNQCPPKGPKSGELSSKSNKEYGGLFPNTCKQKIKQQFECNATQKSMKTSAPPTSLNDDAIEMLNYFDFDRKCCRKPYKSDRQIWSDMNMFDDDMLDNIIQSAFAGDDEKTDDDNLDLDKSDSEDILDINSSKLFPAIFSVHDDDDSDDIFLPCIELEKFDFF